MVSHRMFGLALLGSALTLHPAVAAEGPHWGYEGAEDPTHWGELADEFKECAAGQEQSPIDIVPARAIPAEFNPVELHWQAFTPTVVDNGHTIQVNTGGKGGYAELNGTRYELAQFHFHHESEHTIDGEHAPLEVHFVHQSEAGDLLVLGVMLEQGDESAALKTVEAAWPKAGSEVALADTVDPSNMIPAEADSFRYQGSLTTPPCSQVVTWNVYTTPTEVSDEQVAVFAEHYANNARPVQPLNRRFLLVSED
jgi:carbonic anhydrase